MSIAKPRSLSLLGIGALLSATIALQGTTRAAEDPKPAKPDSPEFLHPPEVQLSAKIEPKLVRPGDHVTYTVTARLDDGWHIYAHAGESKIGGPRPTQFDLFRLDGLKAGEEDAWTSKPKAETKRDPAFDQVVSYHEGTVAWSRTLHVPEDAESGTRRIQSQVSFQICSGAVCKPPVRISVPAVELTVEADQSGTSHAAGPSLKRPDWLRSLTSATLGLTTGLTSPAQAEDGPQPSRKDTPEFLRPKEVTFQASVAPSEAKPGEIVTYSVRAKIQEPWHIYAYSKEPLPAEVAATATNFDLFRLDGLEIDGDWTADREAHAPEDDSEVLVYDFYEGEVTWSVPLRIPSDASAGEKTIASQVYFQICDPTSCKPASRVTVEPASFMVVGGDGEAIAQQGEPAGASSGSDAATAEEETETETPAAAPLATGELRSKIDQGIIPFLIWSALGGVVALLMPCVWPMIPITVNFFVKQGQNDPNRSTTGLAVTYCLAIIGIFTLMGVIFSAVFGATSLIRLANAPWLNFLVAGLFIAFGLSLLGVFEIRLPSFLLNISAKGESRGGLIGVVFMAITLTITSFTCTFPVVGALLVMAAGGSYLYPVVGLATFATVLALPFFLLALAPGVLRNMPKSGDWMNAVKVVGGLVEIGAAFKFLNTAEVSLRGNPTDAWFDAQVLMASWVVLAAVCGFYLLGMFRTNHDHGETGVGAGRILTGTLFLGLALYFAPALFGYPPKSKIYDRLVVGLLPADAGELDAETQIVLRIAEMGLAGPGDTALASADSGELETDPVRRARNFHGVWWGMSYEKAIEQAKASNKPILIDFTGVNCANCRLMEKSVMPRNEVVKRLRRFVPVQLYTDRVPAEGLSAAESEQRAIENLTLEVELTNQQTSPLYLILTPDEEIVALKGGYIEPLQFVEFLDSALEKYDEQNVEVARASE